MKNVKILLFSSIVFLSLMLMVACCVNDNDGDGYYTDGGYCGALDCDDTDPSVGPCVCFWDISIEAGGNFNGNGAVHQFPGEISPSFSLTLNHFDEPNDGLGAVQALDGPTPNEIGSFGVIFNFQFEDRAWTAADGSDETSAMMVITRNSTSELEGTVSGIAASVGATGLMLKPFTLTFRSNHGVIGEPVCGDR
jgi:hypothetical protein